MGAKIVNYFLARLKEPSTWRGIVLLISALGVAMKPELAEAIIALGLALAGGVAAVSPDKPEIKAKKPADLDVHNSDL